MNKTDYEKAKLDQIEADHQYLNKVIDSGNLNQDELKKLKKRRAGLKKEIQQLKLKTNCPNK